MQALPTYVASSVEAVASTTAQQDRIALGRLIAIEGIAVAGRAQEAIGILDLVLLLILAILAD